MGINHLNIIYYSIKIKIIYIYIYEVCAHVLNYNFMSILRYVNAYCIKNENI